MRQAATDRAVCSAVIGATALPAVNAARGSSVEIAAMVQPEAMAGAASQEAIAEAAWPKATAATAQRKARRVGCLAQEAAEKERRRGHASCVRL